MFYCGLENRWFWISWADDIISVGTGLIQGTGAFLEYTGNALNHTIKALTLYGSTEPVLYHLRNANGMPIKN